MVVNVDIVIGKRAILPKSLFSSVHLLWMQPQVHASLKFCANQVQVALFFYFYSGLCDKPALRMTLSVAKAHQPHVDHENHQAATSSTV